MFIILIITVSSLIVSFQVRVQLGLPNHAWQDKRSAIAKTVNDLGDFNFVQPPPIDCNQQNNVSKSNAKRSDERERACLIEKASDRHWHEHAFGVTDSES